DRPAEDGLDLRLRDQVARAQVLAPFLRRLGRGPRGIAAAARAERRREQEREGMPGDRTDVHRRLRGWMRDGRFRTAPARRGGSARGPRAWRWTRAAATRRSRAPGAGPPRRRAVRPAPASPPRRGGARARGWLPRRPPRP